MDTYDSLDGFSTRIWGPALWHVLRVISFNFPPKPNENQIREYSMFIESIGCVLPCGSCRKNFKKNLKTANYGRHVFESRDTFSRFVYDLERCVNHMVTGDENLPHSFEQNRHTYECFRAKCAKTAGVEHGCVLPKGYIKSRCLVVIVPDHGEKTLSFDTHVTCVTPNS